MPIIVNGFTCDSDVEALEQVRRMVHGLLPDWNLPHRFFERRNEISGALTKLLRHASREPRLVGVPRANGALPLPGLRGPYAAPRAVALSLAARVFKAAPAAPVTAPRARPRPAKRVHRFPMPPRTLNSQRSLWP